MHEKGGIRHALREANIPLPLREKLDYVYVCVSLAEVEEASAKLVKRIMAVSSLRPAKPEFAANWEERMFRTLILGMTLAATFAAPALAEEGIVGTWKRPNGTIISYASCGANKFCGTVQTGEYKGKSIGTMSGTGGSYKGEVNKLDEGKTYTGKASVKGNTLSLSGCVMGGLICKSESLTRQ